jgi:serine/threonine-protein kinase
MDDSDTTTGTLPAAATPPEEATRLLPGTLVAGRYRVVALLGRGGMGEVYRAEDLKLGQPVALKFLPAALGGDPERRRRLLDEVRHARRVAHPAVCRVWDVGEAAGHDFLTMEYVDGEDLASLLRRIGRLPEDRAVAVARELCAGLAAVHGQGLLHRDLKPANVMIDGRGRVRLADFGLAAAAAEVTGAEVRSGTPAYMAPEQLEGREATVRSDVFALGLVLYEAFTGHPARPARSAEEARERSGLRSARPGSHVKGLDPAVERVIERCLEPDPSLRPASALAVAAALPGGDPLAAALAAGETPSPEMVAAAGGRSAVRPAIAAGMIGAIAAGLALVAVVADRMTPALGTLDKPPEVLEHEARGILAAARGSEAAAADRTSGFEWAGGGAGSRELGFWYRESPRSLAQGWNIAAGLLSFDNPHPRVPGMAGVRLAADGTLREYVRAPAGVEAPAAGDPFAPLLASAGLDARDLRPVEPRVLPPVFADARAAWEARAGSDAVRVEAAAFRGRPVWLRVDPVPPPAARSSGAVYLGIALAALCLALARRNLRQGRADLAGARRLAVLAASVGFLGYGLLNEPRTYRPEVVFFCVAMHAFYSFFWVTAYLALEPTVRRLWPHALVSWSRLLSGHVRDPLVGRDLLLGTLGGVALATVDWAGGPASAAFPFWAPSLLLGGWRVPGAGLRALGPGFFGVLVILLGLALLRLLVRRTWLAAVLAAALIVPMMAGGLASPLGLAVGLANATLLVGALVGPGLLAAATLFTVDNLLATSVMTARLTAWYADSAAAAILVTLALAAWGAWASLARRPA